MSDLLLVIVIIVDTLTIIRLLPAILTVWKPKRFLSCYRIYRLATCVAIFIGQLVWLLVNLLRSKILVRESIGLTAGVQVIIIVTTTVIDSVFCWVVSSTFVSTIKTQRRLFVKQKGR